MYILFALIALVVVNVLDGSLATLVSSLIIFGLCLWSSSRGETNDIKRNGHKVFGIVFPIYIISAYIFSLSFADGGYFYVNDPQRYLQRFMNVHSWSWSYFWDSLYQCYFMFSDSNALYNNVMDGIAFLGNTSLGGATVFYLTLVQTFFGILCSIEVYKIFTGYFTPKQSSKYAIVFALLSCFLMYSCVIIRDIVIAYFYILGFKVILKECKGTIILKLALYFVIIMGVRLYSGLFFGVIIMFWVYKLAKSRNTSLKVLIVPIALAAGIFVVSSFISQGIMEQTEEEMEMYDELSAERGNISNRLRELPPGVSHIALILFSQARLDPYEFLRIAESSSNYYIALDAMILSFFTFITFFALLYYLFLKGEYGKLSSDDKILFWISILFLALNTSHIDIRRIMGVLPFLYLLYARFNNMYPKQTARNVNLVMFGAYFVLTLGYFMIRG